jgi:hypothetical protein
MFPMFALPAVTLIPQRTPLAVLALLVVPRLMAVTVFPWIDEALAVVFAATLMATNRVATAPAMV